MNYEKHVCCLRENAEKLCCFISDLLSDISCSNSVTFSDNEDNLKKAHTAYRKFTSEALKILNDTDSASAQIASLVCLADSMRNNEETKRLSFILDTYCQWRNALNRFISETDLLFMKRKDGFRISDISAKAQILLNESKNMKGNLSNETLYSCT